MPGPEELSPAELLALLSAKDEQIDALVRVGKLTAGASAGVEAGQGVGDVVEAAVLGRAGSSAAGWVVVDPVGSQAR